MHPCVPGTCVLRRPGQRPHCSPGPREELSIGVPEGKASQRTCVPGTNVPWRPVQRPTRHPGLSPGDQCKAAQGIWGRPVLISAHVRPREKCSLATSAKAYKASEVRLATQYSAGQRPIQAQCMRRRGEGPLATGAKAGPKLAGDPRSWPVRQQRAFRLGDNDPWPRASKAIQG